jgi:hypothetical protein
MKAYKLVLLLTVANSALLMFSLARPYPTAAQGIAQVLRVRALELVDDHGRVRAEIKIFPPDPKVKMPDGTNGYPETVLLRLMDSKGRPNVKIAATEDGSGVSLGGESNPTNIQLLARGDTTVVKLINRDGKQQVIKP